jgi:hypothetical protein
MNKYLLLSILSLATTSVFSQLELFNEGGSSLTFYIGQSQTVQAEGDVSNGTGATMQFEAAGTPLLKLKGNFANHTSGVYTLGTEQIEFNGSSLQTADFGGDNIYGMKTSNSSNVQIDRHVTITGSLEYSTGDVISTTSAYPTIETTGSVTGADDDSHNFGPIAKNFNSTTEFSYPIGDGTAYRYSTFTPASTSALTMRSMYYGSTYPDITYNAPIYKVSQTEYWDMYRTSGAINGVVTLSWDTESGGVTTLADLLVAYYDGTDWNSAGGNNPTGTTASGDVESDAAWSVYDKFFTLATSSSDNALPVELVKFEAEKENETTRLEWETAAEINSDYFSIQKSTNGIEFTEFDQVSAAGLSTEAVSYYSYDFTPSAGNNYYKLVAIDLDQTFEESDVKVVNFTAAEDIELSMKIYPNPTRSVANFNFDAPEDGIYGIKIFNIVGKLVYSANVIGVIGNGEFSINVSTFESGKYFIQLASPSGEIINNSIEKI